MKNRSFRILSLLCAVTLLICAFSAWAAAEETPATPTDLTPVQPQQEPAAAPAQEETEAAAGKQWVCKICGYVYEGDEVPEDYVCPICGAGAAAFEEA